MRKKRKYTRRAPLKAKTENPYGFQIDSTWKPTKASSNHDYIDAIVNTACSLLSKESFPVPMVELTKYCGYKTAHSAASSIRTALRKVVGKNVIGQYGTHVVKDHNGKQIAVRVRKK